MTYGGVPKNGSRAQIYTLSYHYSTRPPAGPERDDEFWTSVAWAMYTDAAATVPGPPRQVIFHWSETTSNKDNSDAKLDVIITGNTLFMEENDEDQELLE
ncbi:hypothetical protein SAMD00023353_1600040 [Rosellinia necatrix]|uniref:Uncharacterized protein n=1 Tax=Rosellinia necatrix TaxID=77044 RepID=A0A1S8A792_ROSNE|nr:hypothetical protein SAMD00023353_1600040 [Rosellinia necatrix]